MPESEHEPRVLSIDAGGTMTDTFIVDRNGEFVVGKAQTTPDNESAGFMESVRDALGYWELSRCGRSRWRTCPAAGWSS